MQKWGGWDSARGDRGVGRCGNKLLDSKMRALLGNTVSLKD